MVNKSDLIMFDVSGWEFERKLNKLIYANKPVDITDGQARRVYASCCRGLIERVELLWDIHKIQQENVFQRMPTKTERAFRIIGASLGVVGAVIPPVLALSHFAHITSEIVALVSEGVAETAHLIAELMEAAEGGHGSAGISSKDLIHEVCFRLVLRYREELRRLDKKHLPEFVEIMAQRMIDVLKDKNVDFSECKNLEDSLHKLINKIDPPPLVKAAQVLNLTIAQHCEDRLFFCLRQRFFERFSLVAFAAIDILELSRKEEGIGYDSPSRRVERNACGTLAATSDRIVVSYNFFSRCSFTKVTKEYPYLLKWMGENYPYVPLTGYDKGESRSCDNLTIDLVMTTNRLAMHQLFLTKLDHDASNDRLDRKAITDAMVPIQLQRMLRLIRTNSKILRAHACRIEKLEKVIALLKGHSLSTASPTHQSPGSNQPSNGLEPLVAPSSHFTPFNRKNFIQKMKKLGVPESFVSKQIDQEIDKDYLKLYKEMKSLSSVEQVKKLISLGWVWEKREEESEDPLGLISKNRMCHEKYKIVRYKCDKRLTWAKSLLKDETFAFIRRVLISKINREPYEDSDCKLTLTIWCKGRVSETRQDAEFYRKVRFFMRVHSYPRSNEKF